MKFNKHLLLTVCTLSIFVGAIEHSHGAGALAELTASSIARRMCLSVIQSHSLKHVSAWDSVRQFSTHKKSNAVAIGHPCIDAVFQYGFCKPSIAKEFLNTVLGFKGKDSITEVLFLPRDLPSQNPIDAMSYNFTVDARCLTQDGRHFLIEMQNDFRDDYHLKALVEHSRMIGRIDLEQSKSHEEKSKGASKEKDTKYWEDIQGIYSIVLTNKAFGKTKKKKTYSNEHIMEPDLLNTYELRNIHHLERRFGDTPNQLILLMLANLKDKPLGELTPLERWAYLFQEKELRYGARKIPETKVIEHPEELIAGDKAMEEFIHRLDVKYLPEDVRERYHRAIAYYNDSIVDIEEKAIAKGEKTKALEIARKMLNRGRPSTEIQEDTGLTAAEIEKLKELK